MKSRDIKNSFKELRRSASRIQPDSAWISRTRLIVRARVQEDFDKGRTWNSQMLTRWVAMVRTPAMAIASVVTVIMGGSIASVSAAGSSLPGDLLYPVKMATEQTQLLLAKDKNEKLKLKTEFVGRRTQEIKDMAATDAPEKNARIQQAAEGLKRDLDTVKNQLHEVSVESSAPEAAQAAKLIDQKSTELITVLKDVKSDMPDNVKAKMTEAEVAAVSTGVKAVQILINTHDVPEVKDVMTDQELLNAINDKVLGMENGIADATKKILNADPGTVTTTKPLVHSQSSSTLPLVSVSANTSTVTSIDQINDAQITLTQMKKLITDNKLDELESKLGEVASAVATVEKTADALNVVTSSASSTDAAAQTTSSAVTPPK